MTMLGKVVFSILLSLYPSQGRRLKDAQGALETLANEGGAHEQSHVLSHGNKSGAEVALKADTVSFEFWLLLEGDYEFSPDGYSGRVKEGEYVVRAVTDDEDRAAKYMEGYIRETKKNFTFGKRVAVKCKWQPDDQGEVKIGSFSQNLDGSPNDEVKHVQKQLASEGAKIEVPNLGHGYVETMQLPPSSFNVLASIPVLQQTQEAQSSIKEDTGTGAALQAALSKSYKTYQNFREIRKFITATTAKDAYKEEVGCCKGFYNNGDYIFHDKWVDCYKDFIQNTGTNHWIPGGKRSYDPWRPCVRR